MSELRNYGVYRLPDAATYVAVPAGACMYFLYDRSRGTQPPPVYEVTAEGRVLRWFGSGPDWLVEQMEDTGETYGRECHFKRRG
jgi:hypothetical protein